MVRQGSAKARTPVRFWASPPIILLVAAFLATALVGPLIGVRELDAASGQQIRLANARSELDALLRIQLAEQTALRGYLSTHDPRFLDEDRPPDPGFDRQAEALETRLRTAAIPDGVQAVEDLRARHSDWERTVAEPLMRNPDSRDSYLQQTEGKFITDSMSRDADVLRVKLQTASDVVERSLRRRINATVAISAGFITLFAILALWYAIGRASAVARLEEGQALVDALQRTLRVAGHRPPSTQMGYAYVSATREALIGGDVLDAWRAGPEVGWILIADASGKGIDAARHAAFTQYAVRALCAGSDDPADVLDRYNRVFIDTFAEPSVFVVVFLAAFDARARLLHYASAGHGTAYVRRGATVETLPPTGAIIGMDRDETYATAVVSLAFGDVVLVATDGLGEARNADGEMLGDERIAALLRDAPSNPQALCDLLVASADAYSGGVQDDLAIVAIRVVQNDADEASEFSAIAESAGLG